MKSRIWVYAETRSGQVSSVVLELLAKANQLAGFFEGGASVEVVLAGHNLEQNITELVPNGVDTIYAVEDQRLQNFSPAAYISVLTEITEKYQPDIFLFGATSVGNILGPSVAARLRTGMAAHCVELRINAKKQLVSNVPAFGGKVISEILCPNTMPQMASVKPGVFAREEMQPRRVEIVREDVSVLLDRSDLFQLEHIKDVEEEPAGIALSNAEIVVCGGFGVATQEEWQLIDSIAKKIGGAVACTRPVVDAGVAAESQMIGTSGCSVHPSVYLGFGISGATHHFCGMTSAGLIININRDTNANVFNYSDVGIIGDAITVLKALDHALK